MKVILNWAMTVDGKIALPSRRQTRISNREDMERVHRLRADVDAILVGVGTILSDDPKLTVKEEFVQSPRQPIRIVLDSNGKTPEQSEVLKGNAKTIIATNVRCKKEFSGAETLRFGEDRVDLRTLLTHLSSIGIKTVLVEGGESVLWSFAKESLADEIYVFIGSMIIGGIASPTPAGGDGFETLEDVLRLKLSSCERLGDGVLLRYDVIE